MMTIPIAARLQRRKRRKTPDTDSPVEGDLVVPIGKFLVCPTGITAVFKPPIPSKLSRHYPWRYVPKGIALLQLVVYGDSFASDMALSQLSSCEADMLEDACGPLRWTMEDETPVLEYETDFVDSIFKLVEWAPLLARQCPYRSVAHDLQKMGEWNTEQLDRYVLSGSVN